MLELREENLWSAVDRDGIPLPWRVVSFFEPDARDEHGRTLLMSAHEPGMARQLLEGGADPNAVVDYGETALQKAHILDLAKVLLEYGADASKGDTGKSSDLFFRAIREHDVEAVRLFLQCGMTHVVWYGHGGDPLSIALIDCGNGPKGEIEQIIQALLEERSDVENRDAYDLKALGHAFRRCHLQMDPALSNDETGGVEWSTR